MDTAYYTFQIERGAVNMDRFLERYHFDESDRELLWGLWCVLTELVVTRAGVVVREEGKRAVCLVTLGERYDRLAELMEESGNLLMGFGLECFGLELLSASYDRLEERVQKDVGAVPAGREFPDAEELFAADADPDCEAGGAPNLQEAFGELGVKWKNGMLHPQKSVLYTVSLETVSGSDPGASRQEGDGGTDKAAEPANPGASRQEGDGGTDKAAEPADPGASRQEGDGGQKRNGSVEGKAGHDCEKCAQADCPFRSSNGRSDGRDDRALCGGDRKTGGQDFPCSSGTVYSYGISRIFGNGGLPDNYR